MRASASFHGQSPLAYVLLHCIHAALRANCLLPHCCRIPIDTFEVVLGLAQDGCRAITAFMRQRLLEHTRKLAMARGAVRA